MLTRSGYIIEGNAEIKKELTVRPEVNGDFGFPPPPFKVFRKSKNGICVPRFYGTAKVGEPTVDKRPEPARANLTFNGTLRDATHQNAALAAALKAGHGVLSLPCGYGKTTVALAIACKLGYRTMIVVHKEFLAAQWEERIRQFCPGASIGRVQQNKKETNCDFIIAMFQSLFRMCPRHVFGLSATPERKDGLTKVLHWFMGPTFFAVERKNQAQVEVFPIKYEHDLFRNPPPCTRFGKISLVNMITELVESRHRNTMLVELIKRASAGTRQLLVLSDRRQHCEMLHQCFLKTSGLYMGGMKEKDLQESSTKKIIFATFSQAHEGLDIPTLDTVILATPKSDIQQSIGRVMRETPGKNNNPHIYDIVDHWSILFAMYKKRLRVYKQGGFRIDAVEDKEEVNPFQGKCQFL